VAFAYHALIPEEHYAQDLLQATTDLYNPLVGFYDGFYETTGKTAIGFTSSTNSMVLESLLYLVTNQQPLMRQTINMNSPWWRAITKGNSSRGLPSTAMQTAKLNCDSFGTYWTSVDRKLQGRKPLALDKGTSQTGL
jgi:hypothetical protein